MLGTVILLSCILLCFRHRPHALTLAKPKPSLQILLINHLLNNTMFLFSRFVVNTVVDYDRAVIDQIRWLNTWWSFWVGNYLLTAPCSVLFVTLDRLLAVKLAQRFTPRRQKQFGFVNTVTMVGIYAFSVANVLIAWPHTNDCNVPGTEQNPIAIRPCLPLLNKLFNFAQLGSTALLSLANIGLGAALLHALWVTKISNINDRIVRITIICEVIFHGAPALAQFALSSLQISFNLNVYSFLLISLDGFVCAVINARLMFRIFRKESQIVVAVQSHHTNVSTK